MWMLSKFDFSIGNIIIDKYSAPGFFTACLWSLYLLSILFLYRDQPVWTKSKENNQELLNQDAGQPFQLDINHGKDENEFGEKYKLERISNIGIFQTPIIIGVFSGLFGIK